MDETRQARRARQACEPCRRKKSKCPGERPACSYCQRVKQQCYYSTAESDPLQIRRNKKIEDRMDNLEGKLDQLLQHLDSGPLSPSQPIPVCQAPTPATIQTVNREASTSLAVENAESSNDFLQSDAANIHAAQMYLTWCHCQPVAIFRADTFLETIEMRDRELLLALKALSLRFPPRVLTTQWSEELRSLAKLSRGIVMQRISNSQVKLSTLQTLCLLSIVDFSDGNVLQAGLSLNIAKFLANCLQSGDSMGDSQELSDTILSILILSHLHGCIHAAANPSIACGNSCDRPSSITSTYNDDLGELDRGIHHYTTKITTVWESARGYAARRVKADLLPPWNPGSDYSQIMLQHMDMDCSVPLRYRFSANRFEDQDLENLQQNRHYWGPWLFIQFLYAAVPCLLNHPFLLSMRLRNFRHTIPQAFIHQSFEQIRRHATWIIYFLEILDKKSFQVTDPSLAHCVAIVATIHLQHSFVQEFELRDKAQKGFEKCMKFLRRMGMFWPGVSNLATNLARLQDSIVLIPSSEGDRAAQKSQPNFSIDTQLLQDILIYERAGLPSAAPDQSIFGDISRARPVNRQEEFAHQASGFNLVGSAGISGHKKASLKDYDAPATSNEEAMVFSLENSGSTPLVDQDMANLGHPSDNPFFYGVGGYGDQENLFFQANDFGKAIENWMNIDIG